MIKLGQELEKNQDIIHDFHGMQDLSKEINENKNKEIKILKKENHLLNK